MSSQHSSAAENNPASIAVSQNRPFYLAMITGSVVVALALSLMSPLADAAGRGEKPPFPKMQLRERARGLQALQALGNRLPEVSAHYRMTPERLSEILSKDKDAWVDRAGHLYFVDEFPEAPQEAVGVSVPETGPTWYPKTYWLSDTFKMHSRPGAQRVIYLDFNGHTVTGSAWNAGTIVAKPFDLDGNPAFSDGELQRIQYIWQRVADDYAPFDIDVTTEEPPADALNRSSTSDLQYGTRAVITRNDFGACSGCGGIAYVGTFDSTNSVYYQPAWVFFEALGGGNEKYTAEAISHEVGHNLGLSHDGTSTVGYYQGHGSGATGWAPIMGVGYYKELVQWSKGEYPDANNKEDDLSVIQLNGGPLKADDFGFTRPSAPAIAGNLSNGTVNVMQYGNIERTGDQDLFSIVAGAGTLQLTITPGVRNPNLHVKALLLNASGAPIAGSSSVDVLNAAFNFFVPAAGTYYLLVEGTGNGDLVTGYSNYASLGYYTVTGSYADSGWIAPVAVAAASPLSGYAPLNVGFSSNGSTDPDGIIVGYNWNFGDGSSSSEVNPMHTYTAPGIYTAVLTVTDWQGLKGTASLTVNVQQDPTANTLHVESIAITSKVVAKTSYQCVASVKINNYSDVGMGGVSVSGSWNGVTNSSGTATTNTTGLATFNSLKTKSRGTCTFTVNNATLSGYSYDSSQNSETKDSLTY